MSDIIDRTATKEAAPKIVEVYGTAPNIDKVNRDRDLTEEERIAWDALKQTGDPTL
jgi:hypothetical protein